MPDIKEILDEIGLPYAYKYFKQYKNKALPDPPYIIWYADNEKYFGSDFENLLRGRNITLEFYSETKDEKTESKIEKALNSIEFEKWEEYNDTEKLFVISYEFYLVTKLED